MLIKRATNWQHKHNKHYVKPTDLHHLNCCRRMSTSQGGQGYSRGSGIKHMQDQWNQRAEVQQQKEKTNPFSAKYQRQAMGKDDVNYGKPMAGSKTDIRGKQAGQHISNEVMQLIYVIASIGGQHPDGTFGVYFSRLFERYTTISNKVVGMLLRARRHGLVDFPGEMLFQGRDDHVFIRLLKSPWEEEVPQVKARLQLLNEAQAKQAGTSGSS